MVMTCKTHPSMLVIVGIASLMLSRCSDSDSASAAVDAAGAMDTVDAAVPQSMCAKAAVATWVVASDDVSVEIETELTDKVDGSSYRLRVLYERYSPEDDVGTFDLANGFDANFGTCRHCFYAVGETAGDPLYFTAQGTLDQRSDPYDQRFDFSVTNLRLIEVTTDPLTRESTPVPGGGCIDVADFAVVDVFPDPTWSCDVAKWADGQACDCACGTGDPDCSTTLGQTPLPVVGCANDETCVFDPVAFAPVCSKNCDWLARVGCAQGICVFDHAGVGSTCSDISASFDPATVGQPCQSGGNLQGLCAIDAGFALGYCDAWGMCRAICAQDSECVEADHRCQHFFLNSPDSLGYCGPPPPEDG